MLKILSTPVKNLENYSPHTKCAEIHYHTLNYQIVCVVCHEIYQHLNEFVQHFQDVHLYDFLEDLQNIYPQNDPLLKNNEKCVKQEKTELLEHVEHQQEIVPTNENMRMVTTVCEEVNICGETMHCKEECVLEGKLESSQIEINTHETETYVTSPKSPQLDWSQTFSPTDLIRQEKRSYKPRNQPNSCSYCGKTFRRRYQLETHLNIHTGLKPHQCDVCGRQFRAITTLQRHLNTHEKRPAFQCQFCSKEFTHRAALVSHETRHTQQRHIPCEDCSKLFYTQNQLDTHRRKLHQNIQDLDDNYSLPYACDMCTKRYRSASMLSTHKFKKHYKSAKFGCELCDKKFVEQSQLNTHMSIHFKKT